MFSQRLELARKRAGLSVRKLSEKIDFLVSPQAISKYEAGKMMPSSSVLVDLSNALDVSLDFLMSSQVTSIECLEFRKHSRATVRHQAIAKAELIDHLERYIAIEDILAIPHKTQWINEYRFDSGASIDSVEERAEELRHDWKLGLDPILSVCHLLESKGIKVILADLPDSVQGLSSKAICRDQSVIEAVVISKHLNVERRRLTLAHELAHITVGSTANPTISLESTMQRFAGAFLVPRESLIDLLGEKRNQISYHEIMQAKHYFGVSASALLVRLEQLGILSSNYVKRAWMTFARSWRKKEPEPLATEERFDIKEQPCQLELLVFHALSEQLISPVRAASLMDLPLDEVEKRIEG